MIIFFLLCEVKSPVLLFCFLVLNEYPFLFYFKNSVYTDNLL